MQRFHSFLVFVLFLVLAAAKLLLPQQAEELRAAFRDFAWREEPYARRLESAGARLAERGFQGGLISVFREEDEPAELPTAQREEVPTDEERAAAAESGGGPEEKAEDSA